MPSFLREKNGTWDFAQPVVKGSAAEPSENFYDPMVQSKIDKSKKDFMNSLDSDDDDGDKNQQTAQKIKAFHCMFCPRVFRHKTNINAHCKEV